jgi:ParB family chromosome partitioning protein
LSFDGTTQRTIDLFSPHGGSVLISDIIIGEKRREVKSDYVQKLADSIKQVGLINPITIAPDNRLIAGYHRLQAFIQLGETRIPAVILNLSELEARLAEIDENLIRNEGSALERGEWLLERKIIYEELYPETRHGLTSERAEVNRNNFVLPPAFTEDTADKTGQSRRTIEQEIQIARDITPEVKDKIRDTELADRKTDLLRLARMEPNQQEQIVDKIVSGEADTINHAKKILAAENVKSVELPEGKYRVIYADPPWQYGGCMNPDAGMAADLQYPTMPLDEIAALPVADLAADNAVLFLWTTSPLLQDSFTIINAWGFQYKASFVWDKVKHNFGYYNSVRHEFLLVCTKGSCTPDNSKLYDSVQSIERTEHSKKPEEFRQIIDDLYPSGPRIELFAREPADNWQSWGNQV